MPAKSATLSLGESDFTDGRVQTLLNAEKPIRLASLVLGKETAKTYASDVASRLCSLHQEGTLTLAVINNVARAQEIFAALQRHIAKLQKPAEAFLVHSRFRPFDRQSIQTTALDEKTIPAGGRILVATQAIEAGVDVSATTLVTELAPWASLVQRFGRCNRRGLCGRNGTSAATVEVLDIETPDDKPNGLTLPYEPDQLTLARETLARCDDVGPKSLEQMQVAMPDPVFHVLRCKDVLELFDTTPDLSGKDLDVSRYIREDGDTDVKVYWRRWSEVDGRHDPPKPNLGSDGFLPPRRVELCSVPIAAMRKFIGDLGKSDGLHNHAWDWDPLSRSWRRLKSSDMNPGIVVLLHVDTGGYNPELGWTGNRSQIVEPVADTAGNSAVINGGKSLDESMSDDDLRGRGAPLIIETHLADVLSSGSAVVATRSGPCRRDEFVIGGSRMA